MPHDLRPFLADVETIVANHQIAPGQYRRWNQLAPPPQPSPVVARAPRDLGPNEYGIADAANILYTLGRFPQSTSAAATTPATPTNRAAWIAALQGRQNPATGLFTEATHNPVHTTAHCIAALELFDARPLYPVTDLLPHATPTAIATFLENLDWRANPWNQSHQGAGLYVSLVLTGALDATSEDRYFDWLWDQADPATGFWRKGCIAPVPLGTITTRFPHLAGSFHYLFNLEYARRPLRYPAKMVDTCLSLFQSDPFALGQSIGFAEIDWVYCLTRAERQSGHRFAEARTALQSFADRYIPWLQSLDPVTHDGLNDLHALFGTICCLAELQTALPGHLHTSVPLKLVLDRRPFI